MSRRRSTIKTKNTDNIKLLLDTTWVNAEKGIFSQERADKTMLNDDVQLPSSKRGGMMWKEIITIMLIPAFLFHFRQQTETRTENNIHDHLPGRNLGSLSEILERDFANLGSLSEILKFDYMSIQENGYGGGSSCHPQWGCLWNDKYCIKFKGQCAMHLEDIDSNCGQWAECAGVICSADYVVNGHMVCLARRKIVRDAKSEGKIAIVKSEMVDLFGYMSIQENGYGGGSSCHPQWGCLWNDKYCIKFQGQCAMYLEDIDSNCGQWAECAGVICSADYVVNGHMVCLARREIVRDAKSDGKIAIVKSEMVDLLHNQDFGDDMSLLPGESGGGSLCVDGKCPWNDLICQNFQGQCAIPIQEIKTKCGNWDECKGVVCRKDYTLDGVNVCLARGAIDLNAVTPGMMSVAKPTLSTMDKDRHTVCSSHWKDPKRYEFEPKDTYYRIKTLQGSDSFFWTYERINRYDKIVLANNLSKDDPKSHWRFVNEGRHGEWQIINRATGSKIRFDRDGTDDTKLALMPEYPFLQGDNHNRKYTETLTFRGHCTNNKVRFDLLKEIFNVYDEVNWVRPSGDMGGSSRTTLQALQLDASSKNQCIKWDWMLEPVTEYKRPDRRDGAVLKVASGPAAAVSGLATSLITNGFWLASAGMGVVGAIGAPLFCFVLDATVFQTGEPTIDEKLADFGEQILEMTQNVVLNAVGTETVHNVLAAVTELRRQFVRQYMGEKKFKVLDAQNADKNDLGRLKDKLQGIGNRYRVEFQKIFPLSGAEDDIDAMRTRVAWDAMKSIALELLTVYEEQVALDAYISYIKEKQAIPHAKNCMEIIDYDIQIQELVNFISDNFKKAKSLLLKKGYEMAEDDFQEKKKDPLTGNYYPYEYKEEMQWDMEHFSYNYDKVLGALNAFKERVENSCGVIIDANGDDEPRERWRLFDPTNAASYSNNFLK